MTFLGKNLSILLLIDQDIFGQKERIELYQLKVIKEIIRL